MVAPHMPHTPPSNSSNENDFSLSGIMTAAGETAYYWDIAADKIVWAPNAPTILNVSDPQFLRTSAQYETLIEEGLSSTRQQAIQNCKGTTNSFGSAYSLQYSLGKNPNGTPVWLEDHGRYTTAPDGTPLVARGVVRIINERRDKEQKLTFLSRHDHLTGQMNRGELWEATSDALLVDSKEQDSYALLLVGVNNLLMINDAFGFDTGDEVIAAIAKRLRKQLRDTDIIGRFSSNKFGLLLADAGANAMAGTAERLLRSIRDEVIETSNGPVAATVSIGGVLIREAATVSQAMGFALEALSKAKAKSYDMFVAYDRNEEKDQTRQHNQKIADELISAIREQRLVIALQPIVRSDTLVTEIHECLLRIKTPEGKIISGGDYIPVAEQLGLIRLVDYRVLELAIDVAKHQSDLVLTINVSGMTATDNNWLELLTSLTQGDRPLCERLIIEITETAAIQDIEESCAFVQRVKQLGCRVAMDDFGTGYNSFRNLQILGIDLVKIDGSFVENMLENPSDQIFVKLLADLALQFNLDVVAECVGDEKTIRTLHDMGIKYLQGYHLGEPVLALPENYRKNILAR